MSADEAYLSIYVRPWAASTTEVLQAHGVSISKGLTSAQVRSHSQTAAAR